ncbi:MAG TPA: alpha/beta hydrolase [Solirubrobacteraceae bacterium]|nr:alpha/beta hydrolase [Solirubrobacteraceae bacterium]
MSLVRVGGVELDCERSGSGPPLFMIMGMGGTMLTWGEPFLDALRRDFELIVYDHRGVGASTRLDGPITIGELARDAVGLLDALRIDSTHVLGISMGGMIAQELVLARPELVRTLALGCTYCGGPGSTPMPADAAARLAEARSSGDRRRAVRTSWEINVSPAYASEDQAWERYLEISRRRPVALEVITRQREATAGHDTCERLGEIDVSTLVVHGSLDRVLPVANGLMVARLIPGARLEVFEGVGHLFFWERPERSAELVRANAAVHA